MLLRVDAWNGYASGRRFVISREGFSCIDMQKVEKTVFISYRRTNLPWALNIYQNLTQHGFDVFIDYDGIGPGDFERVIIENINARAHFLLLLTPSSLVRCDEPGDLFRREIETALETKRNIVPVLFEGFDFGMPTIASQLRGSLTELRRLNCLEIPPQYFMEAMCRLRDTWLNKPLAGVLLMASVPAQQAAAEQKVVADAQPAVSEAELTAQQWFERGFAAKDLDEQLRCYNQAINLKPDNADAFYNRGNAYAAKGMLDASFADYTVAIRIKPDSAAAFYDRGNLGYWRGDLNAALKDYTEAIRLEPNHAAAIRGLAMVRNAQPGWARQWIQSIAAAFTGSYSK